MNCNVRFATDIRQKIVDIIDGILNTYSHGNKDDTDEMYMVCMMLFDGILDDDNIRDKLDMISRFEFLEEHSLKTAALTSILCIKMGFAFNTTVSTIVGALLHDIGMCSLYDQYSNLRDNEYKYSKKDFERIQTHPVIGFDLIKDDNISALSKKIVLLHHVWNDSSKSYNKLGVSMSYPSSYDGYVLKADNKDLSIKIVEASSRFINLTDTNKKYRKSVNRIEALNIIKNESYYRFGEAGLLLLNFISPYKINDMLLINNKNEAVVIRQTNNPFRPVVKIREGSMKNKIIDLSCNQLYMIKSLK